MSDTTDTTEPEEPEEGGTTADTNADVTLGQHEGSETPDDESTDDD